MLTAMFFSFCVHSGVGGFGRGQDGEKDAGRDQPC